MLMRLKRTALVLLSAAVLLCSAGCGLPKEAREAKARGQELLSSGDYAGAAEAFGTALEDTGHASKKHVRDLLEWRADSEFCAGDYRAAKATWTRLLEEYGEKAEYTYYLAASEAGLGEASQALADYRSARDMDRKHASFETPGCVTAFRMTGQALSDAGMTTEAAELCNEEFSAGAEHPEVYNRAGMCCMAEKNYEKAREMFEKGLEKRASGDTEAAAAAQEISEKELAVNLAVLAEYTGDYAGALEAFKDYRDRYGADETVDREIMFLESRVQNPAGE